MTGAVGDSKFVMQQTQTQSVPKFTNFDSNFQKGPVGTDGSTPVIVKGIGAAAGYQLTIDVPQGEDVENYVFDLLHEQNDSIGETIASVRSLFKDGIATAVSVDCKTHEVFETTYSQAYMQKREAETTKAVADQISLLQQRQFTDPKNHSPEDEKIVMNASYMRNTTDYLQAIQSKDEGEIKAVLNELLHFIAIAKEQSDKKEILREIISNENAFVGLGKNNLQGDPISSFIKYLEEQQKRMESDDTDTIRLENENGGEGEDDPLQDTRSQGSRTYSVLETTTRPETPPPGDTDYNDSMLKF